MLEAHSDIALPVLTQIEEDDTRISRTRSIADRFVDSFFVNLRLIDAELVRLVSLIHRCRIKDRGRRTDHQPFRSSCHRNIQISCVQISRV